ncbi:MAG: ABC transporter permease [Anaerolineales bacterium]|jgi:simple sugar transport system permease protein|uniref:ABC transporter permease n=1 Tax=Candidatus Villigracilis affinis TaxID=3140682 RepID=UPI001B5D48C5|nr:ABC transporter permease [Anaerolineales bacterium]MBK9602765.1 ABC transporter permease [Anaerolineales bacterium]MBL0345935.1 ABC transporter permease [Anaerolineales bacterium]MBP8047142.1 ABC transporter permease [Anaerolineales bacterium]
MKKPTKQTITWRRITENRLFFPIVALTLILLFDFIFIPGFFAIENREGNLHGSLIDIFRNGSTVMILAIGMTLVIATGGVDLSVGATMAIAASVAGILMNPSALKNEVFFVTDPNYTFQPLWLVIIAALAISLICGLWNGVLVAYMRIQPMVATLILMISGRGIAQLITNGLRVQITYKPYAFIGQGWVILPFSLYLVAIVFAITWFITRKTAIGMFIESVGINFRSSYFSGIDEKKIKLLVYTFCGFCAGIAGLVASSNIKTSDANNIGLTTELDAILAVVIGGTSMAGGRFSLLASMVGALVMQAITQSMYAIGVPAFALQAIKAVVVIFVILLYSDQVKGFVRKISAPKKEV